MPGCDIFLSYARHDRPTARTFARCLEEEGYTVWWDASLHSGETFDEVIEQSLRDARAVVVLWSPRSVASRWVRAEATLADRRNKLVPAIIEDCDRPIAFELTHTADLSGWDGDRDDVHWRVFVEDLRRHTHAPAHAVLPPPVAAAEPVRPSQPPVSPAPAAEVHCLELLEGDVPDELIVVDSSGMKIGRSAPAEIVIPHRSVSREHCVIGLASDELLVTDLNSTNGTYVDGVRIRRATILPVGSVLRIGQIALRHAVRSDARGGDEAGMQVTPLLATS
jgi:hypothetical protein